MKLPSDLPLGAGRLKTESIRTRFSTMAEMTQYLTETMGYVPLNAPQYACPVLTAEMLTTADWKEYTINYAWFKSWWDFYREKLAEISAFVLQYKNMLLIIETATRKTQRELANAINEKLTAERLKERVLENPEYQDTLLELQRWQQAKEMVEAKFESLDKSMAMLSRQIEIRKLDLEQTNISGNLLTRNAPRRL